MISRAGKWSDTLGLSLRAYHDVMVPEFQNKTMRLQRARMLVSTKTPTQKDDTAVDVRSTTCECDYPGCHNAFCRNEHLRPHKQTYRLNLPLMDALHNAQANMPV